ncbi:hypothetical protein PRIPAC_78042 [Pristionchus pacificus]|uniref:G protein-coupled receptor n=1 Tax=Pristionchus pacificus TaxID=54126 RepID=A0A2A6CNI4_PRIPA|nr:hypothetical protein PRIPAC_78042 [Pristionchus pacificus]|eukprot:PDM79658.1 G protein-coupled receptor [Pristionchus pacificus]
MKSEYFSISKIVSACSCVCNSISILFLIKLTPNSQTGVRNYLLAIQIALIVSDVHLEMGMQPIPLFALIGGYGVGFLLKAGCVTLVIYVITEMIIILCLIYRHQTVVLEGNAFKFRKRTILHVVMLTAPIVPGVIFAFSGYDSETLDRMLHEASYYLNFLFINYSNYLRSHLFISMNIFIIPASVIFIGLSADDIIPNNATDVSCTSTLHSFFHNLILLTVTPTYRQAIISFVRKPRLRVRPSQTG